MSSKRLLRANIPAQLNRWLDDAGHSGIYALQRFALKVRQDIEAVTNALREPWSSGQVEGQISRLKTLKRSMYGRHHRATARREVANGQAGRIVQTVYAVARETFEQPVCQHCPCAAASLLRRLEDEVHGASERRVVSQAAGCAEQHGGVAIMTTRMHHAWHGGQMACLITQLMTAALYRRCSSSDSFRRLSPKSGEDR